MHETALASPNSAPMKCLGGRIRAMNWLAAAECGPGASKMLLWYPKGL